LISSASPAPIFLKTAWFQARHPGRSLLLALFVYQASLTARVGLNEFFFPAGLMTNILCVSCKEFGCGLVFNHILPVPCCVCGVINALQPLVGARPRHTTDVTESDDHDR
tara:strand:+ start:31339 stop:31668 length:330 start_codon:yes stop_codon:yes gene_type:complete